MEYTTIRRLVFNEVDRLTKELERFDTNKSMDFLQMRSYNIFNNALKQLSAEYKSIFNSDLMDDWRAKRLEEYYDNL